MGLGKENDPDTGHCHNTGSEADPEMWGPAPVIPYISNHFFPQKGWGPGPLSPKFASVGHLLYQFWHYWIPSNCIFQYCQLFIYSVNFQVLMGLPD